MGVTEGGKIQMQAARPHARGSKNSHENNFILKVHFGTTVSLWGLEQFWGAQQELGSTI